MDASEKAITVATGGKPKADTGPPPSQVSVEVQNGNAVAGAADDAAYLLGQIGYQSANGGNADNFDYFRTSVLYDPAVDGSEPAAQCGGEALRGRRGQGGAAGRRSSPRCCA